MEKWEELQRYDSTVFTATYNITYNKSQNSKIQSFFQLSSSTQFRLGTEMKYV